jgi:hypothetical protein
MGQTVLALVQEFCGKKTLPVPTSVVGNTETSVVQIRYLLQEAVREAVTDKGGWQEQLVRGTWVSTAAEDQGALSTLLPGFSALKAGTMWDVSQKLPVLGPLGDISWQTLKVFVGTGPLYQYRIEASRLKILPILPAGHTMSVYYETTYGIVSNAGTAKNTITADDDTFLLSDSLMQRSLDFRWKRAKGEPWENDYNDYMDILSGDMYSPSKPVLSLDGSGREGQKPGVWVPSGNWNIV